MIAETIPLDAYADIIGELQVMNGRRPRPGKPDHPALVWGNEISERVLDVDWLMKGLIERQTLVLVYGAPKCGKTFAMIDIALHVATGRDWMGHKVKDSDLVVYVAREGISGVKRRVMAHTRHHDLSADAASLLAIAVEELNLRDRDSVRRLISTIREAERVSGRRVALIVIDTLARSMAGGDENSVQDIGLAIAGADAIRVETGAAVCLVHHSGKDADRGPRGSTALTGAVDLSLVVSRDKVNGVSRISTELQREGDGEFAASFRLERVVLGIDEDGDEIASMAVVPTDDPGNRKRTKPLADGARIALDALTDLIARKGQPVPPGDRVPNGAVGVAESDWRAAVDDRSPDLEPEARRKRFARGAEKLIREGYVAKAGGYVWLIGEPK